MDGFVRPFLCEGLRWGGCLKMLFKVEKKGSVYVSAKRTHRFLRQRPSVSPYEAGINGGLVLSSFGGFVFQNEPTGRMFRGGFWSICAELCRSWNCGCLGMLRAAGPDLGWGKSILGSRRRRNAEAEYGGSKQCAGNDISPL